MTDDLDLFTPTPATVNVGTRKCRRHDWVANFNWDGGPSSTHIMQCVRCNAVRDEATVRRNRNNAKRGKTIQRKRIEALGGMNLPGNKENHDGIGLAFSYESKSGGAFSERYARWLAGIPKMAGQTGVLIVTETPGPGRRARSYVVVDYDEWRDLHGELRGPQDEGETA